MEEHNGFFKVGDCIEISGSVFGLVVSADSETVGVRKIVHTGTGPLIVNEIKLYRNGAEDYSDKYWIRTIPAPSYGDFSLEFLP